MRRTPVALVPLAVSILLAACAGDRDTTAPRTIAPSENGAALNLPVCSYQQMRSDARGFLPSTDVIFSIINDAKNASDPTPYLWQVAARITETRLGAQLTPWASTAIYGELTILDAFACMPGGVGDVSTVAAGSIATALYTGIIGVKGGGFSTAPELGKVEVNGAAAFGAPRYGLEHNPVGSQWASNPFLLVGVPTNVGPSGLPYATQFNTNGVSKNAIDLFTIPVNQPKSHLDPQGNLVPNYIFGVCIPAISSSNGAVNLLEHWGQIQEHIDPIQVCDPQFATLSQPSGFASLARRAVSFFAPKLAFGDEVGTADEGGGGPTSWSPVTLGSLTPSGVLLTFTVQPTNGNIGQTLHFEVTATFNGLTVPDVNVTMAINGNFGTPGTLVGDTEVSTDANGVASFDLSFTKAGQYILLATGEIGGFATQSGISQQLWIKNQ